MPTNRDNQVLRQIITFAREEGHIPVANTVKVPRERDDTARRPHFTRDQINTILATAEQRVDDIKHARHQRDRKVLLGYVRLLRWTGMRPAEALSLTWRDIDLENSKIYLRKGKTDERIIPMLFVELFNGLRELQALRRDELTAAGEQWRESDPLFMGRDGKAIGSFSSSFGNLLDACGLEEPPGQEDYCSYSFRHSLVTELGTMGMPDALLTKVFGTSREMIGAHYDHTSAQQALDWMRGHGVGATIPAGIFPSLDLTTSDLPAIPLTVKIG